MFVMEDLELEVFGVGHVDSIISLEETIRVQRPSWVRFLRLEVNGCDGVSRYMLNLYTTYARNGTINVLLPFTDLLRNARPYIACPASFSSHLQLQS